MAHPDNFTTLEQIIERAKNLGLAYFAEQLEATQNAGYELVKRGNIQPVVARLENISEGEKATVFYIIEIMPECGFNVPSVVEIRKKLLARKGKNDRERTDNL